MTTNTIWDQSIALDRLVEKRNVISTEMKETRKKMDAIASVIKSKSYDDNEEKYQLEDILMRLQKRNDTLAIMYRKNDTKITHMMQARDPSSK